MLLHIRLSEYIEADKQQIGITLPLVKFHLEARYYAKRHPSVKQSAQQLVHTLPAWLHTQLDLYQQS